MIQQENGDLTGGYIPGQYGARRWLDTALVELLPRLGETLLAGVAAVLRRHEAKQVTLIPGGRLNLLPLHAAVYTRDGQSTPTIFGDEFTVSYAPSAQAHHAARRQLAARNGSQPSLLGIGNPLPLTEAHPLRYARPEVEEVERHFNGNAALFYETEAVHDAIAAAIPGKNYLHFSCHGGFDAADPLQSGLLLSHDERLTLRQLLDELDLDAARLAVLSACQTAISDFNNLPDEVIGLPAGFLRAGVPGVVGALWSVPDLSTALLMDRFYRLHFENDLPPAQALQAAQQWLRRATNAELAELFHDFRANAPDRPEETRMAYALAQKAFTEHATRAGSKTPYADPYYWAAFTFYGV